MKKMRMVLVLVVGLMGIGCASLEELLHREESPLAKRFERIEEGRTQVAPGVRGQQEHEDTRGQNTIHAVDEKTFRFQKSKQEVWETALAVLIKNYNLNIVDEKSGVISTEWDSFYIENDLYRNKLSFYVRPYGYRNTEVVVHNTVEKKLLRSQSLSSSWLPTEDNLAEVPRVINNMATYMREEAPFNYAQIRKSKEAQSQEKATIYDSTAY